MEIRIQQKATIWYETTVEAETPEQAIEIAQNDTGDLDWWQALDSVEFQDEYWTEADE